MPHLLLFKTKESLPEEVSSGLHPTMHDFTCDCVAIEHSSPFQTTHYVRLKTVVHCSQCLLQIQAHSSCSCKQLCEWTHFPGHTAARHTHSISFQYCPALQLCVRDKGPWERDRGVRKGQRVIRGSQEQLRALLGLTPILPS